MGESRFIVGAVALALCARPAVARESEEPLEMAPSSAWVMDYAEDSCALRRVFKADADEVLLQLRAFGPGNFFEVTAASPTLEAVEKRLKVRFDPDEGFAEPTDAFYFDQKESDGIVYSDSLYPNALKKKQQQPGGQEWSEADRVVRERAITSLTIAEGFEEPLVLKTGAMHQPMNAMRTCLDELLGHWGLDPAVQRTLSRPAKPLEIEKWARRVQQNYPAEMLRQRRSGMAAIRLIVGPDGRPTACVPNKDSIDTGFDDPACEMLMRYAQFEPALDVNGQPTASFWTTRIVYSVGP
jgi:hypothetical protein